jgi:hypothetical protein
MVKDAYVAPVEMNVHKEVVVAEDEAKEKASSKQLDSEPWSVQNVQARLMGLIGLASSMTINKQLMKFFAKVLLVACDDPK